MDEENFLPLPRWLRHGLIGVGLFLAGAALAFGYSYRPLHGALSWQVDQLEAKLDLATDADKEGLSFERAEFNHHFVEAEGSYGIHNYKYVLQSIYDSTDILDNGLLDGSAEGTRP